MATLPYYSSYQRQKPPVTSDQRLLVGLVLGVLFLILAVGLLFLLRCVIFRDTRSGFCLRRDMEVDSGDYDNAGSSVNEKSSLGRMDSGSPPAVVPEKDEASASPSYDDIAEEGPGETWPLTKEDAPGGAPEDTPITCFSDVAPTPRADSVSYGADNHQPEDYDDVAAADQLHVPETVVEVHSGLRTPPRELPQVPTDDMEGVTYYLEPDNQG
ncbi:hypothetical protein N1851_012105 [Merluccius polli]|uniref:Uncharacterized protein n=1 Tax=Merluccius polli TaxID=89951 RepID=A0AA47P2J6_MERPO|nr:hypothetical protein N1851_012105 [Merluccius polli]